MKRPMEPAWRSGYKAPSPRRAKPATHADRFALLAESRAEIQALRERWALSDAREDLLDLLVARVAQLGCEEVGG